MCAKNVIFLSLLNISNNNHKNMAIHRLKLLHTIFGEISIDFFFFFIAMNLYEIIMLLP